MNYCTCTPAEAAGITEDPWHNQPHPQPATLLTIDSSPLVAETPKSLIQTWVTPNKFYYARNHFDTPNIDTNDWTLLVDGQVQVPSKFSLSQLQSLPQRTIAVTMECAGNNRVDLVPPVSGNQFSGGAVSTAIWTGTSLRDILKDTVPNSEVTEVLFEGADSGVPEPGRDPVHYKRSLLISHAMDPDIILAYKMNNEVLPIEHGYPLRLVVPRWYGMASVKWLTRITLSSRKFEGFFQKEKYVVPGENGEYEPLNHMLVKSLITRPRHGVFCSIGQNTINGLAWSGGAAISKVEFSDDSGQQWQLAQLGGLSDRYAWRQWSIDWHTSTAGHYTLIARAHDESGAVQPKENHWNPKGYALNGVQAVCVNVS